MSGQDIRIDADILLERRMVIESFKQTSASGRKQPVNSYDFRLVEGPLSGKAVIRRRTFADGTWLETGHGVLCLSKKKRKAKNAFSIREKPIWAIRERKIKAERNNRKRLSVVQRKNDN